jgi:hypothetical protein
MVVKAASQGRVTGPGGRVWILRPSARSAVERVFVKPVEASADQEEIRFPGRTKAPWELVPVVAFMDYQIIPSHSGISS